MPASAGRRKRSSDLALLQKGAATESTKLYTAAVVAAELGEGQDEAFAPARGGPERPAWRSRTGLRRRLRLCPGLAGPRPAGPGRRSESGRASDPVTPGGDRQRLLGLRSHPGGLRPRPDPRPAGLRRADGGGPARIVAMTRSGSLMRGSRGPRVTASTRRLTSGAAASWPPRDIGRSRCPRSRTTPDGPPVMASVWHRPLVSEPAKDELAERQARAAVALVRLGHAGDGLAAACGTAPIPGCAASS